MKKSALLFTRAFNFSRPVSVALILTMIIGCSSYGPRDQSSGTQTSTSKITLTPNAELIRSHMAYLASDELLGREAGTPGYDAAAEYVATEFEKLGLAPGGTQGSFFQYVPLRTSVRQAETVALEAFSMDGSEVDLKMKADYVVSGSLNSSQSDVTADVVFAGFGLVAPELGRDDYQGLDVEGKIVALLSRTPSGIQSEERAYYGSQKSKEASKRGAVGIISLYTPVAEKIYAFERISKENRLDSARMGWLQEDGVVHSKAPNLKVSATFSMQGASKLFTNAPSSWEEVLSAAEADGGKTPTFNLPIKMRIKQQSTMSNSRSANVIGVIAGSDPGLANEVLVLSAHLDHLGLSKTDEEDVINNGALDNAAGVATLIETARMILEMPSPPRRTVAFLANTAEEKGLLGAEYFVNNQTFGEKTVVGNVNLDMPVLTYDFQDVVVFGGDRSTIRAAITTAADQMGLVMADDPFPEQGVFTRSDHFRFVEAGIPAVMLATGMANGGEQAWAKHFAEDYHRPSDDMNNDINFEAAAKFAELKTRITLQLANADQRPLWNKGDFFGRNFNGPMTSD